MIHELYRIMVSSTTMDLQLPPFPILIASFIFILIALKTVKKRSDAISLPPGPWKLPLLGNTDHFIGSVRHQKLRDLAQQYGPDLMHIKLGQISTVVASSPEAAKQIMKTNDVIFAQRPFLRAPDIILYVTKDIVFAPYGDYWRRLKKICITELLSPKSVQSFRPIREEEVSNLVTLISSNAGSTINLSRKIFSLTFSITTRAAFGEKLKDQEEFIATVDEALQLGGRFTFTDAFPSFKFLDTFSRLRSKFEKIHQKLDNILQRMIDEHKSSQATMKTGVGEQNQDLLAVLLNLQKHGDLEFTLSNDNIKAVIVDIFAAGTETSSTTAEWAVSEMLKSPSVMDKAQAEVRNVFSKKGVVDEPGLHELKYLKFVIKETLRLHPPAPLLLPRESLERHEIFGYEIPVKTKVIVNAWAIGRDSKYWSEAERFLPERFADSSIDYKGANFECIPFGVGRRICPGIQFGIANIELPLARLLFHFDWKLPNEAKLEILDMDEAVGLTVRRRNDLCLIPTPVNVGLGAWLMGGINYVLKLCIFPTSV